MRIPCAQLVAPVLGKVCYPVLLQDAYGDGWNDASLTFTSATTGAPVLLPSELAVAEEKKEYRTDVCFDCGCYFGQATAGSYPEENSWNLRDSAGAILASAEEADRSRTFCTVSSSSCPTYPECSKGRGLNRDLTACEPCSAGQFSSLSGARVDSCSPCGAGKYNNDVEATACNSCGEGYTSHAGSTSSEDCFRNPLILLFLSTSGEDWDSSCSKNWLNGDPCENEWYGVDCDESGENVIELTLFDCGLKGPIPKELGQMKKLKQLWLYNNTITAFPSELGDMSSLVALDLSYNNISGTIPHELGRLQNLVTLDLSSNNLLGSIPSELGDIPNLQWIDLSSNRLESSIPVELSRRQSLEGIFLAKNLLSGSIPLEIGLLPNLVSFDVLSNKLTGPIPEALQKRCVSETLSKTYIACRLSGNDVTCPTGTSLLFNGCLPCPIPERCPGGTRWGGYCSPGFVELDCSVCPEGWYELNEQCLRCSSGWAHGFESVVYCLAAVIFASVLLRVLVRFKIFHPGAFLRWFHVDTNTIVCLKQLGAVLQIMSLLCSVVVQPAWFGRLSK